LHQPQHGGDVEEIRDVADLDRLGAEQRGRNLRQGSILGPVEICTDPLSWLPPRITSRSIPNLSWGFLDKLAFGGPTIQPANVTQESCRVFRLGLTLEVSLPSPDQVGGGR